MSCDRFIFLVTVSVLSNLVNNALSLEATASTNLVIEQTTTPVNNIQIAQADPSLDSDRSQTKNDNLKNSTAEEPFAIDKRLGLVGIAIASSISLILLKFLFIPPDKKVSPTPISSAIKTKGSKTIENDHDRAIIDTSQPLVDFEAIQKPTSISPPLVKSFDRERYEEKPIVENFETISQLTVLNSNTPKIDAVVELIKYLQQPDEDLRREAIWKLARIGDFRGIEPLTEILSQVNSTDRSLALEAITQITRRSFQPIEELVFLTFDDANPEIKQNAIRDLAAVYAFVALITKQLARMQVDRDMQVRQSAKLAIEQLNLCYFRLFDDCSGSTTYDSNFNGQRKPRRADASSADVPKERRIA